MSEPRVEAAEPDVLKDWVLEALEDMKALDIAPLPVGKTSTVADWFIICSGTSDTHCRAIAAEVGRKFKAAGMLPLNAGDGGSASWTLLDYGNVVLHVFSREARQRYNLEAIWDPVLVEAEKKARAEAKAAEKAEKAAKAKAKSDA